MNSVQFDVLVEQKNEYMKTLSSLLSQPIYDGIQSMFEEAVGLEREDENYLIVFQKLLKKIPKWNEVVLEEEANRIMKASDCVWLEDLVAAIFRANTRILTASRNIKVDDVEYSSPKLPYFIHKCWIESAREIYKNPYLFYLDASHREKQKNKRDILKIIDTGIYEAVRKMLPVQKILEKYLGEGSDVEEETIDRSDVNLSKIKKMIARDVESQLEEPQKEKVLNDNNEDIENNEEEVEKTEEISTQPENEENLIKEGDNEEIIETENLENKDDNRNEDEKKEHFEEKESLEEEQMNENNKVENNEDLVEKENLDDNHEENSTTSRSDVEERLSHLSQKAGSEEDWEEEFNMYETDEEIDLEKVYYHSDTDEQLSEVSDTSLMKLQAEIVLKQDEEKSKSEDDEGVSMVSLGISKGYKPKKIVYNRKDKKIRRKKDIIKEESDKKRDKVESVMERIQKRKDKIETVKKSRQPLLFNDIDSGSDSNPEAILD